MDATKLTSDQIAACTTEAINSYIGLPTAGWSPADFAVSLVGVKEEGGRNLGPPDVLFNLSLKDGSAWCSLFVMACYAAAGRPLPDRAAQWWKRRNAAEMCAALVNVRMGPGLRPEPSDICAVPQEGGSGVHVGIVERVNHDRIITIEGNLRDSVERVERHPAAMVAFFRPGGGW